MTDNSDPQLELARRLNPGPNPAPVIFREQQKPRELTNSEQYYRWAYFELKKMRLAGRHDDAELFAYDLYMDASIPDMLRLSCCVTLAQQKGTNNHGDGDYVTFAEEAAQLAEKIHNLAPENKKFEDLARDTKRLLQVAKEDHAEDMAKLTAREARREAKAAAKAAKRAAAVAAAEAVKRSKAEIASSQSSSESSEVSEVFELAPDSVDLSTKPSEVGRSEISFDDKAVPKDDGKGKFGEGSAPKNVQRLILGGQEAGVQTDEQLPTTEGVTMYWE